MEFSDRSNILNINVGILGHVDSGKTSLVKALSTSLSTAALDKNPQSQQRGITLDLGFSAFTVAKPEHLDCDYDYVQFTLVDCPGHASLIRTIIGGAQIIDMMLLVVDANKGIQTQTAECIVIGEITTDKLIIVLNKIDMLPKDEREQRIERVTKRIRKAFSTTKFCDAPIVLTSAAVGGEKVASVGASTSQEGKAFVVHSDGVDELVELIRKSITVPQRNVDAPFYYSIDHCFPIKGHGTVLTGTVLSGSVAINSIIEIPHCQIQRKVKSMQMFRKAVKVAKQGDRVGICVTNLDPTMIERGVAASPGSIPLLTTVLCMVKKVRFFKPACRSNTKFHVSIGHSTVIATAVFYGAFELAKLLGHSLSTDAVGGSKTLVEVADSRTSGQRLGARAQREETEVEENAGNLHKDGAGGECEIDSEPVDEVIDRLGSRFNAESEFPTEIRSNHGAHISVGHLPSHLLHDDGGTSTSLMIPSTGFVSPATANGGAGGGTGKGQKVSKQGSAGAAEKPRQSALNATYHNSFPVIDYPWEADYQYQEELVGSSGLKYGQEPVQWAVLQFQQPVFCPLGSLVIGSRLDTDTKDTSGTGAAHQCRLAFFGPVRESITDEDMHRVRVFNWRFKEGEVFRINDVRGGVCYELIAWKMFHETSSVTSFLGMKVETEKGHVGVITGSFGSGGKFRVKFAGGARISAGDKLIMRFKRFIYDKEKSMQQVGVGEETVVEAEDPRIDEEARERAAQKAASKKNKHDKKVSGTKQQPEVTAVLTSERSPLNDSDENEQEAKFPEGGRDEDQGDDKVSTRNTQAQPRAVDESNGYKPTLVVDKKLGGSTRAAQREDGPLSLAAPSATPQPLQTALKASREGKSYAAIVAPPSKDHEIASSNPAHASPATGAVVVTVSASATASSSSSVEGKTPLRASIPRDDSKAALKMTKDSSPRNVITSTNSNSVGAVCSEVAKSPALSTTGSRTSSSSRSDKASTTTESFTSSSTSGVTANTTSSITSSSNSGEKASTTSSSTAVDKASSHFAPGAVTRKGIIESIKPEGGTSPSAEIAIVRDAFRMEENIRVWVGAPVVGPGGQTGELLGPFAKMGKCKVRFVSGCTDGLGGEVEILLSSSP